MRASGAALVLMLSAATASGRGAAGSRLARSPVFDRSEEVVLEGEVALRETGGVARITVRKGDVVVRGGGLRVGKYLEITVAEGATLTIHSPIAGGAERGAEIVFDRERAEAWPGALAGLGKKGGGRLVLAGANSYRGLTVVFGGALELARSDAVPGTIVGGNRSTVVCGFPVDQRFLEAHFDSNVCGEVCLALGEDCAEDLDFSRVPGLANASLGAAGAVRYGGRLTPARGVYRLGGGGGDLTLTEPAAADGALLVRGGKVVLPDGSSFADEVVSGARLFVGNAEVVAAPTSLAAAATEDRKIELTWFDHALGEGGYLLEESTDGVRWRRLAECGADVTSHSFAAPERARIFYRVRAWQGDTRSAPSNTVEVDTRAGALEAPEIVDITAGYRWLDVKWECDSARVAGFVVAHSTDGETFAEAARVLGPRRRRAHIYMPKTQTNYLRVAALDYGGRPGPWSHVRTAKTDRDADVQADLIRRFRLLDESRKFTPDAPASLPRYSADEKARQREAGKRLVADVVRDLRSGETYTIPPGVYRVPTNMTFEDKRAFTISAAGARFIYEGERDAALFHFRRCEGGTVAGPMIVQYDVPHFAVARVAAVDAKAMTIDAEVLPGYSTEFDKAPFRSWFPVTEDGHQGARAKFRRVESLGRRKIRMHYSYVLGHRPRVGGYIALNSNVPWVYPVYGDSRANASRNMTYRDITGYGTMAQHYHEGEGGTVRFINYRILPQPGTSQVACGQPGQFFMNRTGTLVMDGCEFNTAWDDGINLCATSGIVSAQDASNVVYLHRLDTDVRAGDRLSFYDFDTLEFKGRGRVEEVEVVQGAEFVNAGNFWFKTRGGKHTYHTRAAKVTLDRNVGDVMFAQVFNDDLGASDIIVRNCYWRDMMPDAIMMQSARRGLIANNLFFHNVGPAVHTQMNQFWLEGKWSDNMTVVNNVSWENAPPWRNYSSARAAFSFHASRENPGVPLIENYVIDGNRSYNNAWPGIQAANLKSALIARNLIVNPCLGLRRPDPARFATQDNSTGMKSFPEDAAGIVLHGGRDITLVDNTIVFDRELATVRKGIHVGPGVDAATLVDEGNRVVTEDRTPPRPDFGK
jgi:autotransporter-associated beta strand protein